MVLDHIHKEFSIENVMITTFQAVSGAGEQGIKELEEQSQSISTAANVFSKNIAGNVIPQCDRFLENGFTKEEMKLDWETKKILDEKIHVTSTCVRVPVINGHSESVFIKVRNEASRSRIIKLLGSKEGIKVIDDPSKESFPTALENANKTNDVYVGRIRSSKINNEDLSEQSWVNSNELMTETLAKVFIKQKKYVKALEAYQILGLKYPEKNSFFADRIKEIKDLQKLKN